MNAIEPSDSTLMRDLARGQPHALGPLYLRYGRMVKTVLMRLEPGIDLSVVDDLAQEVFLTLARTASRYREQGQLKSWLCGISARKLQDWRRRRRNRLLLLERRGDPVAPSPAPRPDEQAAAREALGRALKALPVDFREVLVLHHMEGLSAEQIGAALQISTNTVWTRLHRARKAMQLAVEAR